MDIIFLGVNDVGLQIYEWLCDRDSVNMVALLTEKSQLDLVHDVRPDLLISVGFDHLVPSDILDVPPQGAINLHPALLPYNRGKSPNVWPLIEGTPAGVTLHYMDESFDTGEIISQRQIETDFADTGKQLHRRLENTQYDLFTEVWPDIESGQIDTVPQDSENGSYHTTDDFLELCKIAPDEEVQAKEFLDQLRALTFPPFNNARIEVGGETYYIDVEIRQEDENNPDVDGLLSSY
jgi:methionyl-tRNA formyltransferase